MFPNLQRGLHLPPAALSSFILAFLSRMVCGEEEEARTVAGSSCVGEGRSIIPFLRLGISASTAAIFQEDLLLDSSPVGLNAESVPWLMLQSLGQ